MNDCFYDDYLYALARPVGSTARFKFVYFYKGDYYDTEHPLQTKGLFPSQFVFSEGDISWLRLLWGEDNYEFKILSCRDYLNIMVVDDNEILLTPHLRQRVFASSKAEALQLQKVLKEQGYETRVEVQKVPCLDKILLEDCEEDVISIERYCLLPA